MKQKAVYGTTFFGHEISDYGKEHGYVDYGTLAKAFDAVLNNNIFEKMEQMGYYWEPYCGSEIYYEDKEGDRYTPTERDERIEELNREREDLESEMEALEGADGIENSIKCDEIESRIEEIETDLEMLDEELYEDVFQYYIISDVGATILAEYTDEIVLYNEMLDINLWCVTHYGTSWDYVLTDIKCNVGEVGENA